MIIRIVFGWENIKISVQEMDFRRVETRELGVFRPDVFTRRVRGAEALVKRLIFHASLTAHEGCVHTVHFNQSGDILVSGSEDNKVIFWNWSAQSQKLAYRSGHSDFVVRARILPFTDDRKVVTSGVDGEIRLGLISEDGQTNTGKLGAHEGLVYGLAIEPGSPHVFYSCGEDGFVRHFDLRRSSATELLSCSSFNENRQPVRLTAIAIDPRNPNYFSVGGHDEYARVYDVRKCWGDSTPESDLPIQMFSPPHLIDSNQMRITGLAYSRESELLVSYNDELIYLFPKNMDLSHNPQVFSGHRNALTMKGVSFFGPSDEYVVSGSDCGHVFIWKKKNGVVVRMMMGGDIVNCIEPHPHFPFLATSGLENTVRLWMPTASNGAYILPDNAGMVSTTNKLGRENPRVQASVPWVALRVGGRLHRRRERYFNGERATNNANVAHDDDREAFALGSTDNDGASSQEADHDSCSIC